MSTDRLYELYITQVSNFSCESIVHDDGHNDWHTDEEPNWGRHGDYYTDKHLDV